MMIEEPDTGVAFEKYRSNSEAEDKGWWSGANVVWDQVDLDMGEGIAEESRLKAFSQYKDFKDPKKRKYLEAWSDTTAWYLHGTTEDSRRTEVEEHIESGRFTLDTEGNLVDSKSTWSTGWFYDEDAIKGALIAKANGWNETKEKLAYRELATTKQEDIQKRMEYQDIGLGQSAMGMALGYGAQAETLFEIAASPTKIVGQTIFKGAMKALAIEGGIAALGESGREYRIRQHKEIMGEEYGLWDSVENILIAASLGGGLRAGGSAFVDWRIAKNIKSKPGLGKSIVKEMEAKGVPIELAQLNQEIVNRFMRRETYRLTNDTTKHIDMMFKAEHDINSGKQVDITKHSDVSIEERVNELTGDESYAKAPEVDMAKEIAQDDIVKKTYQQIEDIQKTVDDAPEIKPISKTDPYNGRVTKADGDAKINEAGGSEENLAIDEEIAALEAKIQQKPKEQSRASQIQEASSPLIGGSEDDAAAAVKDFFKQRPLTEEQKIKSLSAEDIKHLDEIYTPLGIDGQPVFAKFGDNLAAGTVAGVGEDENGNITFDPAKFVAGFAGYTAAKAFVKNAKVRQEFKDYAIRKIDEFENIPGSKYVTGMQKIEDSQGYFFRGTKTSDHTKTETGVIWYAKDSDLANEYASKEFGFEKGATITQAKAKEDVVLLDLGSMTKKTSVADLIFKAINEAGLNPQSLDEPTKDLIKKVIKDNRGEDEAIYQLFYNDPRIVDILKKLDFDGVQGTEGMGQGRDFTIGVFNEKSLKYKHSTEGDN